MKTPGIGDAFQSETKYQRGRLPGGRLNWASKPETHKHYPSAARIPLSVPQTEGGILKAKFVSFVIQRRRVVNK